MILVDWDGSRTRGIVPGSFSDTVRVGMDLARYIDGEIPEEITRLAIKTLRAGDGGGKYRHKSVYRGGVSFKAIGGSYVTVTLNHANERYPSNPISHEFGTIFGPAIIIVVKGSIVSHALDRHFSHIQGVTAEVRQRALSGVL